MFHSEGRFSPCMYHQRETNRSRETDRDTHRPRQPERNRETDKDRHRERQLERQKTLYHTTEHSLFPSAHVLLETQRERRDGRGERERRRERQRERDRVTGRESCMFERVLCFSPHLFSTCVPHKHRDTERHRDRDTETQRDTEIERKLYV